MRRLGWLLAALLSIVCALAIVQPGNAQIVVNGGGGGNISAGSSNQQILFNNNGVIGGFGTWDGSLLTIPGSITANAAVAGDEIFFEMKNTSNTAGSAATFSIATIGDSATGSVGLYLTTHQEESDEAQFSISLAGDSGNNTPLTTVTSPGLLAFSALTTTGAATGKKVVCVDTATGILYASSTGVDCSN